MGEIALYVVSLRATFFKRSDIFPLKIGVSTSKIAETEGCCFVADDVAKVARESNFNCIYSHLKKGAMREKIALWERHFRSQEKSTKRNSC